MADLAKLVVKLEAQSAQLTAELNKAKRQLTRFDADIEKVAKKIGTGLGIAISATATGLAVMLKNSIDAADELSKMAQKVGIATDQLSKLNYAAKLADVETEALGAALAKLSKAAVDPTKDQVAAFQGLGVSLKDAQGNLKSTDVLLSDLADAFARFADGPEKTAAAMAILGKSGAQLIPLLNGGSKAIKEAGDQLERFGGVVTPEAGRAAEKFNDDLTALKTAAGGVANAVAMNLIGSLGDLSGKLVSTAENGDRLKIVSEGITEAVQTMAIGIVVAGEAIVGIAKAVRAVGGSFESVYADIKFAAEAAKNLSPVGAVLGRDLGDLDKLLQERNRVAQEANTRYVDLWNYNGTAVSDALRASFNAQKNYVDQSKALLSSINDLLPKAPSGPEAMIPLRPGLDMTEPARQQLKFSSALEKSASASKKAKQEHDEYAASLEAAANIQKEVERLEEENNKHLEEAKRLYEETRTPIENYRAELEKLEMLRARFDAGLPGGISDEVYRRQLGNLEEQYNQALKKTEKTTDQMSVFAERAAQNMQDAFADILFDPFSDGLDGMLANFADIPTSPRFQ